MYGCVHSVQIEDLKMYQLDVAFEAKYHVMQPLSDGRTQGLRCLLRRRLMFSTGLHIVSEVE